MEEDVILGDVKNRVLPPSGIHNAICVGVVMLGTIEELFEGHPKKQKKIRLSFELVDTKHVFDTKKGPEPFVIHHEYTLAMGTTANLRKLLNGLAGDAGLSDERAKNWNIASLLGCEMVLSLVVSTSKAGNKSVKISSMSQRPEGSQDLQPTKELLLFTFAKELKTEVFNKLPEYVQTKIKSSDEYKELYGAHAVASSVQAPSTTTGEVKKSKSPF